MFSIHFLGKLGRQLCRFFLRVKAQSSRDDLKIISISVTALVISLFLWSLHAAKSGLSPQEPWHMAYRLSGWNCEKT